MVWCRVAAIAGLTACMAGCAQGRDAPRAPAASPEPSHAPVATRGPDDGMPFRSPGNGAPAPAVEPSAVPAPDNPPPHDGLRPTE